LKRVWPRVPAIAVTGILAGLAIVIGLVLLIVPGLYLLTIWSLIVPAIVLENKGIGEAFGRSRELVRGYAWTVFGVVVGVFVLLVLAGIVLSLVLSPLDDSIARYLSDVVSNTLLAPFVAATLTVMYFELRALKEPAVEPGLGGAAFRE
jgi:phage shock protein PspC (stress-responsive transcriptional regulator)